MDKLTSFQQELEKGQKEAFDQFYLNISPEYKTLKKLSYECQSKCYIDERQLDQSEKCAENCMKNQTELKFLMDYKAESCMGQHGKREMGCLEQKGVLLECYQIIDKEFKKCLDRTTQMLKKQYKEQIMAFSK